MASEEEKRFTGPLRGQLLFAVVFVLASVLLLSQIGEQTRWVKGTKFAAQPRFWPMVSLIGMVGFGALHLYFLPRRRFTRRDVVEWTLWARALEWVGWFLAYVIAVPIIGYLPVTLVFAPLLAWRMGYRTRRMLWISAGFGAAVVILFKALLQVKIPGAAAYEYLPGALRSFFILNF